MCPRHPRGKSISCPWRLVQLRFSFLERTPFESQVIAHSHFGLLLVFIPICEVRAQATSSARKVDFIKEVQPLFEKSCYSCHGEKVQMGGLRLDSKKLALDGGLSGKTIRPGSAAESSLYQRIAGIGEQVRMPMGKDPLPADQIQIVRAWIDQGADWPDGVGTASAEIKKHWAYVPPKRSELPKVSNASWVANPIDRFVLARLDKEKLAPSAEADRVTLLRGSVWISSGCRQLPKKWLHS